VNDPIGFERPSLLSQGSLLSKSPVTIEISEEYKSDILHWHNYVQIWYVAEGSLCHTIDGKLYIQEPGSVVTVLPYTVHNIDTRDSKTAPRFAMISFTDKFLTDNGYSFFSYIKEYAQFEGKRLSLLHTFDSELKAVSDDIINDMHREFSNSSNMSYAKLSSLLASLLLLLTSENESADTSRLKYLSERAADVTRVVRYMSEHYSEKITLDELCDIAHMSRRFLTQSFREITGKTAFEILTSIRINHARSSLLYSDLTLSEIARNVGFTTKNRLAHEFSKRFPISPMEFRNRFRAEFLAYDEKFFERWDWLDSSDKL